MPLSNALVASPASRLRPQVQDLETENIADLAVRARALEDVIPLWYGEGDLVTPAFIRDASKRALDDGHTFYVPDMHGTAPLREAMSRYQTGLHGRPVDADRTTVTPGGMQSVLLAMELVADMGTNVVYVEPQWPNVKSVVHLVGAEAGEAVTQRRHRQGAAIPDGQRLGRQRLQGGAHAVQLADVAGIQPPDVQHAAAARGHQSFLLQMPQRLAHRGPADAEPSGELDLAQVRPRRERAGGERGAKGFEAALAQRAALQCGDDGRLHRGDLDQSRAIYRQSSGLYNVDSRHLALPAAHLSWTGVRRPS